MINLLTNREAKRIITNINEGYTMRNNILTKVILMGLMLLPLKSMGAVVLDTTAGAFGGYSIRASVSHGSPLGQSFTINQAMENFSLGGVFFDADSSTAAIDITFSLYQGAGLGGVLIGSTIFSMADGFDGLHNEDFSSVGQLSAGTYTVFFGSVENAAIRLHNGDIANTDPYNPDGIIHLGSPTQELEFAVLVTADVAPVPLPAGAWLFGSAIVGLIGLRTKFV